MTTRSQGVELTEEDPYQGIARPRGTHSGPKQDVMRSLGSKKLNELSPLEQKYLDGYMRLLAGGPNLEDKAYEELGAEFKSLDEIDIYSNAPPGNIGDKTVREVLAQFESELDVENPRERGEYFPGMLWTTIGNLYGLQATTVSDPDTQNTFAQDPDSSLEHKGEDIVGTPDPSGPSQHDSEEAQPYTPDPWDGVEEVTSPPNSPRQEGDSGQSVFQTPQQPTQPKAPDQSRTPGGVDIGIWKDAFPDVENWDNEDWKHNQEDEGDDDEVVEETPPDEGEAAPAALFDEHPPSWYNENDENNWANLFGGDEDWEAPDAPVTPPPSPPVTPPPIPPAPFLAPFAPPPKKYVPPPPGRRFKVVSRPVKPTPPQRLSGIFARPEDTHNQLENRQGHSAYRRGKRTQPGGTRISMARLQKINRRG